MLCPRRTLKPWSATVSSRYLIPVVGLLAILVAGVAADLSLERPDIIFLRDDGDTRWIVHDEPVELRARFSSESVVLFRIFVEVDDESPTAILEIEALREITVYLSGAEIFQGQGDWRPTHHVALGEHLRPGRQELAIRVRNQDGPADLRVRCGQLDLHTGPGWQTNRGDGWTPARLASVRPLPAVALDVPSGFQALLSKLWVWILVFGVVTMLGIRHSSGRSIPAIRWIVRPRNLQFVLLGLWSVLSLNNFWRLPPEAGFDLSAHLDYIRFIVERGALPLADDGWQMFQMPLFYIIAALPYAVLSAVMQSPGVENVLRLIPLACGALQIVIGSRALALVFPDRDDLQCIGLLLIAFLPVNIYMSQYVGNEPMAAMFSALVLLKLLEILSNPRRGLEPRAQILLSLALAAAILTKVTAILLVPVTILVLFRTLGRRDGALVSGRLLVFLLLLSGWPFARNLLEFGNPLVFASGSVSWWQDPGYRMAGDLLSFGRALDRPVFASTAGLWNALYSTFWVDGQMSSFIEVRWFPPWNLSFVLAGAWLGVPLAVAMAVGAVHGILRRQPAVVLAVGCVALYLLAVAQQFLSLPIYSTAKASYTLGLLPLYAILLASGVGVMARGAMTRSIVLGFTVSWAAFSYIGYFIF